MIYIYIYVYMLEIWRSSERFEKQTCRTSSIKASWQSRLFWKVRFSNNEIDEYKAMFKYWKDSCVFCVCASCHKLLILVLVWDPVYTSVCMNIIQSYVSTCSDLPNNWKYIYLYIYIYIYISIYIYVYI